MLIRSQDKEMIINMTVTNHIYVEEAYRPNGNLFDVSTDETILGHYSTKAKAMKVLDMIQEAYVNGHIDRRWKHEPYQRQIKAVRG